MAEQSGNFESVGALLEAWRPRQPVYCIYPHVYRETARSFVAGFPGRVLYAVKANDETAVLRLLFSGGVRHFDCASLPEIALVNECCPGAACYFMVPVTLRGAVGEAFEFFGVRHFMIDDERRLDAIAAEVPLGECVVFARMAVSHEAAVVDLSSKFGAPPDQIPGLLSRIRERGAEPALAFNVGTMVTRPEAYRHALEVAADVLTRVPFPVRLMDIGGGFARSYPDFTVPPLEDYLEAVRDVSRTVPLAPGGEILAEPGRALAAPGLSAVVEVLLRKDRKLYINDGMYGVFWELRFKAHQRYATRVWRDGREFGGTPADFAVFGPTCDSSDVLPAPVPLPAGLREGDYIEFGQIGAYSLGGRTRFNGHFSDHIVQITAAGERPP